MDIKEHRSNISLSDLSDDHNLILYREKKVTLTNPNFGPLPQNRSVFEKTDFILQI